VTNDSSSAEPNRHGSDAPRLVLRFAAYTGLVLLAAGLAIFWTVDREVASRAERAVETQARVVTEANLRRQLVASDFAAPVSGARLAALDALFRRKVLIPGIVGARLFNRGGEITYAARHQLIGTKVPYTRNLADVFAGKSTSRVTRTVSWEGTPNVKVIQSLIPVQASRSGPPVGALELDQDYRAVNITVGNAGHRLVLILAVAFLVLYLSLFPILRRVTGQLEGRNKRLRDQASERETLLEAERTARAEAESIQRLLAEQNERLRDVDRMKDEFVSLVSHELRTPLTSIRGYLELLLDEGGDLTPEQERFLKVVDRNSQRLLELVGDLLLLAQIDAGKFEIEFDEVDLARVVNESVEACRPLAESRKVSLAASICTLRPLLGDRARLAQVLDNLISNAVKFTPARGRVEVRVSSDGRRAVVEVEDTGLGISAEEQPRLFERFFRSSQATANAIPGTGLGLTITKAIVERHHGRITLESQEHVGTTVRVEIPIEAPTAADAVAAEVAARAGGR
jgi:signal transduction histidine kinase